MPDDCRGKDGVKSLGYKNLNVIIMFSCRILVETAKFVVEYIVDII